MFATQVDWGVQDHETADAQVMAYRRPSTVIVINPEGFCLHRFDPHNSPIGLVARRVGVEMWGRGGKSCRKLVDVFDLAGQF